MHFFNVLRRVYRRLTTWSETKSFERRYTTTTAELSPSQLGSPLSQSPRRRTATQNPGPTPARPPPSKIKPSSDRRPQRSSISDNNSTPTRLQNPTAQPPPQRLRRTPRRETAISNSGPATAQAPPPQPKPPSDRRPQRPPISDNNSTPTRIRKRTRPENIRPHTALPVSAAIPANTNRRGTERSTPTAAPTHTSASATAPSPRDCVVCLDSKSVLQFAKITDSCTHLPRTCRPCVPILLTSALNDKAWTDPQCPECQSTFSLQDVQRLGTPEQASRYGDRLMKRYLQSLPEYRGCLALKCSDGQLHSDGDAAPIVTCRSCGSKSCFTHKAPWHAGQTCDQYEESSKNSAADDRKNIEMSEALVRKICKSCPGCKFDIQKSEGCDHMTCRRCGFEFCYICLASYKIIRKSGNSAHESSCTHYRPWNAD